MIDFLKFQGFVIFLLAVVQGATLSDVRADPAGIESESVYINARHTNDDAALNRAIQQGVAEILTDLKTYTPDQMRETLTDNGYHRLQACRSYDCIRSALEPLGITQYLFGWQRPNKPNCDPTEAACMDSWEPTCRVHLAGYDAKRQNYANLEHSPCDRHSLVTSARKLGRQWARRHQARRRAVEQCERLQSHDEDPESQAPQKYPMVWTADAFAETSGGEIDMEGVIRTINSRYLGRLDRCRRRGARKLGRPLQGCVTVRLQVGGSRLSPRRRVDGHTMEAPGLHECILDRVQHWRFGDLAQGEHTLVIPIVFELLEP
jgi:hypothetical protein